MRIVRCLVAGEPAYGLVQGERICTLAEGEPFAGRWTAGRDLGRLDEQTLLAPCTPSKIVAIGRNYVAHAQEHGAEVPQAPLLFLKPASAVIAAGEAIQLTPQSQQVEHEAELAVVIGRRACKVERQDALAYVLGYTCANDVTARDLQRSDGQWTRAKGFDTFCPLGPWIETSLSPADLHVLCRVNEQVRQDGRTRDLVFDVAYLVSYISQIMTLLPGDVILTGTPAGVSPIVADDRVEVEIEGIGVLSNPVRG